MFWRNFLGALFSDFGVVKENDDNLVTIEYLDPGSGSWKYGGAAVGTPSINLKMKAIHGGIEGRRVRAVRKDGSVVDILT